MDNFEYQTVQTLQVRKNQFLLYNKSFRKRIVDPTNQKTVLRNLKEAAVYSGSVTKDAKKRMQKAIRLLVMISEWQTIKNPETGKIFKMLLNFITLTLPCEQGLITDQEIKKQCLERFIRILRERFKVKSYIWRAERQKNGNLHFHITTNVFIPHYYIKDVWNECLNKLGFIDRFEKKHGHRHPNSTDIHAVRKIENIEAYLVKYMSKDSGPDQTVLGKIWDCSKNLKTKEVCEMAVTFENAEYIEESMNRADTKISYTDHCTIIRMTDDGFRKCCKSVIKHTYLAYIDTIRNLN